ncbi:hypothetical protein TNCV_502741, partial [Trichonephila clavipes]
IVLHQSLEWLHRSLHTPPFIDHRSSFLLVLEVWLPPQLWPLVFQEEAKADEENDSEDYAADSRRSSSTFEPTF